MPNYKVSLKATIDCNATFNVNAVNEENAVKKAKRLKVVAAPWEENSGNIEVVEIKFVEETLNEKKYRNPIHQQFYEDMERNDTFEITEDYHGRSFYKGPAVSVSSHRELLNVIRATQVLVVWDNMGKGWIIYPG